MSATATSAERRPASGASTVVIWAARSGAGDAPLGADSHQYPAAADHHAGNRAAGQAGGDLAEPAAAGGQGVAAPAAVT